MKADINLIAEKCGVSKATVSRVFTGKAGVSEEVKAKVLAAARSMNYTPKQVAAQENIAIVVDSLEDFKFFTGFYSMLAMGMIAEFTRSGYQIRTICINDIDLLGAYTKAAILLINEKTLASNIEKLKKLAIPLLTANQPSPISYSVCTDHAQGIELAVEHLLANGHERIALFMDGISGWGGQERLRGYHETMKKHKIPAMKEHACSKERSMLETIAILLKAKPSALIVCGESLVAEFAYSMNLLNIRIPEDLSVISFEKGDLSRWLTPAHTTISQDVNALSKAAMDLMRAAVSGELKSPQIKILNNELIVRDSVKKLS